MRSDAATARPVEQTKPVVDSGTRVDQGGNQSESKHPDLHGESMEVIPDLGFEAAVS